MPLNAGIIMAGRQPDIVNTLAQSSRAAAITDANQKQNQLNQLYQAQGPGILAGDQGALNALAQADPRQALQFQQVQRQNARQDRQDALSEQEFAFRLQQFASANDAATVKREAEEYKQIVQMAGTAQTPEEWDRLVTQFGGDDAPELLGQFENKDALLGKYMTAAQILEQSQPETPLSKEGKLKADLDAGRITPAQFEAAMKKQGLRVTSDGSGGVTIEQGVGVAGNNAPPKLTVDAAKNTGFFIRTREANAILNELEDQGTRFGQQVLDSVPLGLGNFGRDPDFQRFDQARRDFVNSILRRESGAVISDAEFENANKQYFPVPGDSPEVIAQKRQNRINAIEGLRVGSGEGAAFVENQEEREGLIPDFRNMSDEELDAYIAQNGGAQ